ncbi:MAG: DUF5777 family beta-barrel protein [Syntrophothermus sp.]
MNTAKKIYALLFLCAATLTIQAQEISWKHTEESLPVNVQLFRSAQSIVLPTTETLQKGDFEFEISHRFLPPVNTGLKRLWGIDGPVNMRLALSYALTDNSLISLGRSNSNDNVDLSLRYKILQVPGATAPFAAALRGGIGWNTLVFDLNTGNERAAGDNRNFQYYGQLILNTVINKRLGIGLVPSYLYNSSVYTGEKKNSVMLGTYAEVYLDKMWGVIFEWSPTLNGYTNGYTPVALGVELNTGGHFFKVMVTNASQINPSEYIAGETDYSFKDTGNWRLGFNITRLLKF